jgi:hypothetical protein
MGTKHRPFDNPHDAVREHGTLGGRKQSRQASQRSPTALLFVRPWCLVSSLAADRLLDTAAQSARFAPVGRGQQSLQRSVVQSGGIALAFHRQAQHRARQLVRFHSFVADRLERQPRFVESCL